MKANKKMQATYGRIELQLNSFNVLNGRLTFLFLLIKLYINSICHAIIIFKKYITIGGMYVER
jgi:hypothetical protein